MKNSLAWCEIVASPAFPALISPEGPIKLLARVVGYLYTWLSNGIDTLTSFRSLVTTLEWT